MSKRKPTPFPSWLSDKPGGYELRYIRLGNSQLLSPAVKSLGPIAFRVYVYMLLEAGGKREFEFPHAKYARLCSNDGFTHALKELDRAGLVKTIEKNSNLRKPNKYQFAEDWRLYNPP